MRREYLPSVLALTLCLAAGAEAAISSPSAHFGFEPGTDGAYAPWDQIVTYYRRLDVESDRVETRELGKTTLGNPFLLVTISSPANLARASRYKEIARQLADPRGLTSQQVNRLAEEGRTAVAVTLGLHSTEVAATQMGPQLAHRLATSNDPQIRTILDNVIFLLFPCFNPDGQLMVADWIKKTAGTRYEGSGLPELYHHYVGHDNNRDAYMFTQAESRHFSQVVYHEWFPQLYLDVHQMGSYGARLYIPPYYDPVHPNVDPLIWREHMLVGGHMAVDLEAEGVIGVESGAPYDAWWMASFHMITNYHNIAGMLTETASAKLVWPLFIHPHQLQPGVRGRPLYAPQVSFPNPWPGGWWRLKDMMRQQEISTLSLLDVAARYRETFLRNMALKARRSIELGEKELPHAFVIPARQRDPGTALKLIETLMRGGVEIHRAAAPFRSGSLAFDGGDYVIALAQPLRAYVKSLLEPVRYPDNEWTRKRDGSPLRPYDMAAFTLAEHMGVEAIPLEERVTAKLEKLASAPKLSGSVAGSGSAGWLLSPAANDSFRAVNRILKSGGEVFRLRKPSSPWAPGTFWIPAGNTQSPAIAALADEFGLEFTAAGAPPEGPALQLKPLRLGLYRRYQGGNMDEGWTRFIFDAWEFPYTRIEASEIQKGDLAGRFDVLLFADDEFDTVMGKKARAEWEEPEEYPEILLPPEYTRGLAEEGVKALKDFVLAGGALVLLDTASHLAIEKFGIPVRDVVKGLPEKDFFCPGSTLRVEMDPSHPLAYGMPDRALVLFWGSPAFEINPTVRNAAIDVVARYGERDLLQSGWLIGEERIVKKAALLEVDYGKGRLVLVGFRPQHRSQTHSTFKILFNAVYYGGAAEVELPERPTSGGSF